MHLQLVIVWAKEHSNIIKKLFQQKVVHIWSLYPIFVLTFKKKIIVYLHIEHSYILICKIIYLLK